jgi:DMSO/TMAO reductase YedYZ molybdopterin-dependent catalytic subunit
VPDPTVSASQDLGAANLRTPCAQGGIHTWAAAGLGVRPRPAAAQDTLPDYADFKLGDAMIVHSDNTIETRRDAFGTALVTPERKLYVRNNISPPGEDILADLDAWEVAFEGVVEARTLTVGELKSMGLETVAMVLQCSGNGTIRSARRRWPGSSPGASRRRRPTRG